MRTRPGGSPSPKPLLDSHSPSTATPYGRPSRRPDALVMTITTQVPVPRAASLAVQTGVVLDLVVPVYNEEVALAGSVRRLHRYLAESFPYRTRITIADNASTDATLAIAYDLAEQLGDIEVLHLEQKGRGRALRAAWTRSQAPVLAYLDVDLSTDLAALLPLVAPLVSGHSDLAIGT